MTNENELLYLVISVLLLLILSFILTETGPRRR